MLTRSRSIMKSTWQSMSCSSGKQVPSKDSPGPTNSSEEDAADSEGDASAEEGYVLTAGPVQLAPAANQKLYRSPVRRPVYEGDMVQLAVSPKIYLLKGFLSAKEADYLINKAQATMARSRVLDTTTGRSKYSDSRTSFSTFLHSKADTIVAAIEQRLSHMTSLPQELAEGLQVIRYTEGQAFDAHYDSFTQQFLDEHPDTRQRLATVIMYLSTPELGGETAFPFAETRTGERLMVKSTRGDALLFYNLTQIGERDANSVHKSCPVRAGTKWCCTQWYEPEFAASCQ